MDFLGVNSFVLCTESAWWQGVMSFRGFSKRVPTETQIENAGKTS